MALKLRKKTLFPALVTAQSPIVLTKTGALYDFSFNTTALESQLDDRYLSANFTQSGTGAVTRDFIGKVQETISVTDFGAKGDGIILADGAISASSKNFTSASASFAASDAGKLIRIAGAGAAGVALETTIATVTGAGAITTTDAASATVTGATFAYGSNDTAALQAAITAAQSGKMLHLIRGVYLTAVPLVISGPIRFYGDGSDIFSKYGSVIQPSKSSNAINVTCQNSLTLEDFGVFYVATPANTTDAAINIDSGGGASYNYFSRYRNISIINAYNGVRFRQAIYGVMDGLNIQEYANVGIVVSEDNPASFGDFGNLKIINSNIFAFVQTPVAGVYWSSGGGFAFHNNTCLGGQIGVSLNPRPNTDMTQVSIFGNQFDTLSSTGIQYVRQDATANLQELVIACNTFNSITRGVYIPNDAGGIGIKTITIVGNAIRGSSSVSARPITIDSADNVTIAGNSIISNNASTVGVTIGSAATNVVLGPNSFSGTFANDWTNASASFKAANGVQPNLGGILYSGSDRVSLLSGTATAGQMLRSGNVAAPTWSTATWPNTTAINTLLYSSSANTISALATANSSVLLTNGSGVPAWSTTLPRANGGGATSVAGEQAALSLRLLAVTVNVNFNSANTDTPIPFTMPTGYTRMVPFRVLINGASAAISSSNFGIFTATAGGGAAIQAAATGSTVTTSSDATLNNTANFSLLQTTSFVAASLATPNTIYFRVGTAQGSAATANVTFYYFAEP
jgi:hypothetical protein